MYDVITIGSATRDMFLKSKSFEIKEDKNGDKFETIPFGEKMLVEEVFFASGGGGTNSAVTFARQGFKTACISVIGNDSTGADILNELKLEGVDPSLIITHKELASAFSVVLVHGSGERSILSFKGEGQHFVTSETDFNNLDCKWLYIDSTGGNLDFLKKIVSCAQANNIKMAWNPGGMDIKLGAIQLQPILEYCDLLFMNKEEAHKVLGVEDISDPLKLANALRSYASKAVITITDGRNGSCTLTNQDEMIQGSIPDSPIVDATGAGDAFASGFTVEYIDSGDIDRAIKFGTANATAVVAYYGAKKGILRKGEVGYLDSVITKII